MSEMEKKLKEAEDRSKTLDRSLKDNKDRVEELKKEVNKVVWLYVSAHLERNRWPSKKESRSLSIA